MLLQKDDIFSLTLSWNFFSIRKTDKLTVLSSELLQPQDRYKTDTSRFFSWQGTFFRHVTCKEKVKTLVNLSHAAVGMLLYLSNPINGVICKYIPKGTVAIVMGGELEVPPRLMSESWLKDYCLHLLINNLPKGNQLILEPMTAVWSFKS